MNILFVNYGDFTTNSLNHIAGFANTLGVRGHACVVAVPQGKETIAQVHQPLFIPATYDEALNASDVFPDHRPADVIHAWTPREGVRKFVLAYQRAQKTPARLIVHLEDNERHLLEAFTGQTFARLRTDVASRATWLVDGLPHPLRHEALLRIADGVTCIVERLQEFVPPHTPSLLLPPGIDPQLYHAEPADPALRSELGLRPEERVLVFTGSNTFANEPEMRELYLAVALLNHRGIPTRLVRTGFSSPGFLAKISEDVKRHVLDLGFVAKSRLPKLLALADALVQPGRAGPFNDYRLPSKLPEFLASGRPVILPDTNIGKKLKDGVDAILLEQGSPEEIADACARVFANPELGRQLGEHGAAFARQHFDLGSTTARLADFYGDVLAKPSETDWKDARDPFATEATLLANRVADQVATPGVEAATLTAEIDLLRQLVHELELALDQGRDRALEAECSRLRTLAELTQRHAENLERQTAEQSRLTQEHVRNLEQQNSERLRLAGQHIENLEAQLRTRTAEAETSLAHAQQHIAELTGQVTAAATTLARAQDEAARASAAQHHAEELLSAEQRARTDAEAELKRRDDKIARMQRSFSWQATAPLRALRRTLLDRPPPPQLSDKVIGNIDYPQDWTAVPATLNVCGWTLHRDKIPIRAVRARLGKKVTVAELGVERLDVLDHFRDFPAAERCGWLLKVEVPRWGRHVLAIEAEDQSGAWHLCFTRTVERAKNAVAPAPNSYGAWLETYDTLTPDEADRIRQKLRALQRRPLISVLMPVYNVDEKWLVAAIESVRRQLYGHWELCIADDASNRPHIRRVLTRYREKDPRIKVVFRETNGHISAASNSALALAQGEFVALFDHDDELRPHALACVALELDRHPEADVIYSDEDKIDENGRRYDHYFKPDWNPDLFRVQNFVSHLGVYRTSLVREVGQFRIGYEGSQDWDLAMRVIERSAPERIRHIPKILYHWRSVAGSTAMIIGAKSYAVRAAEKAIRDHLTRSGLKAEISATKGAYWRIHYPVPDPAPLVSLIMPTRNRRNVLEPCVESIISRTTYPNYEIIVVDNDSDDPETLAYLNSLEQRFAEGRNPASATVSAGRNGEGSASDHVSGPKRVRILHHPGPFNYSAINNYAVRQSTAPLIGLLNNDLEVIHGDWLEEMVSNAVRPEIGCVGAKLYYPTDRIQHAGVILGIGGVAAHAWQTHPRGIAGQSHRALLQQNLSAVTAACLVIRRETYLAVGGLEEEKLKVAFNDVDFCLKVRSAGYWNLWTPYAELYHHESASRGAEDTLEKRDRFRSEVEYMTSKWGEVLLNDPAYNPNLTLTVNDFTLAVPPRPWPPLA